MRRRTMALTALVLALVVLAGPASAASITVRPDPDDSSSSLDIRKVWSDAAPSGVLIRVGTWNAMRFREGIFLVELDTQGSPAYDLQIEIMPGLCLVEKLDGEFIGRRDPTRPDPRDITCRMPTGWFGIEKTVRFVVLSVDGSGRTLDRAPNDRRFVGL